MTTDTPSITPISSFGPEILQALIHGSTDELRVEMPYAMAVKFTMRVHQCRAQMRKHSHPLYVTVARTRVSIKWPPDTSVTRSSKNVPRPTDPKTPCTVVISPHDSEFTDALVKAGLSRDDITSAPAISEDDPPLSSTPTRTLGDILGGGEPTND